LNPSKEKKNWWYEYKVKREGTLSLKKEAIADEDEVISETTGQQQNRSFEFPQRV